MCTSRLLDVCCTSSSLDHIPVRNKDREERGEGLSPNKGFTFNAERSGKHFSKKSFARTVTWPTLTISKAEIKYCYSDTLPF